MASYYNFFDKNNPLPYYGGRKIQGRRRLHERNSHNRLDGIYWQQSGSGITEKPDACITVIDKFDPFYDPEVKKEI